MTCHLGDFAEYAALRRRLSDREAELSRQRGAARRAAGGALAGGAAARRRHPGAGRAAGPVLAVVPRRRASAPRGDGPVAAGADRRQAGQAAVPGRLPGPGGAGRAPAHPEERSTPRSPKDRANLVSTVHDKLGDRDLGQAAQGARPRRRGRRDPPAAPGDPRSTPATAATSGRTTPAGPSATTSCCARPRRCARRVEGRSHVIARTFDRVCGVLDQLGYLDERERVTAEGRRLAQLYTELDLLTAECLRAGLWDDLDPAELAACVSCLVFESRQADDAAPAAGSRPARRRRRWPTWSGSGASWRRIEKRPRPVVPARARLRVRLGGLPLGQGPQPGRRAARRRTWPPGDFVRWVKQLLDLLGQIRDAAPQNSHVRGTANQAIEAMQPRRGRLLVARLMPARPRVSGRARRAAG